MNYSLRVLAAASSMAILSTSVVAQSSDGTQEVPKALFVQHSETAQLSDGIMTLGGVNNHMIMFADRPFRAANTIATKDLVDIWTKGKDSFADDPPNAAVVGEVDGKPTTLIVEITNPQLSGDNLTFSYSLIEGEDSVTLEKSYIVIDETLWGDLGAVSSSVLTETGVAQLYNNTIITPD